MKGQHVILVLAMLALPVATFAQGECPDFQTSEGPFGPQGGSGSFAVQPMVGSSGQCWWAPTGIAFDPDEQPWLHITQYAWDGGPGTVDYSVDANTDPGERTGVISVANQPLHTVTQEGNCQIAVDPALEGTLFVTNTACERVVELSSDYASGYNVVYPTSYPADPVIAGQGIEYGPDGMLYVADPAGGVYRIALTGPDSGVPQTIVTQDYHPTALRFTHRGDLIMVDGTNYLVYRVPNTAAAVGDPLTFGSPQPIGSPTNIVALTDLTTAAKGDLLVAGKDSGGGKVWKMEFFPETGAYGSPQLVASGRTSPQGIARTARGDIIVGDGPQLWKYTAAEWSACGPALGGEILNVEPSADDTLYVTVQDSPTQATLHEVPFDTENSECGTTEATIATFTVTNPTGTTPLFGVAVPNTDTDLGKELSEATKIEFDMPTDVQAFNFFDSLYEFRAVDNPGCTVEVTADEFSATRVKELIESLPAGTPPARPVTFWGDNGRAIGYHYEATEGSYCPSGAPALYDHAINAYTSAFKPQIMRCANPDSATPNCQLISFKSYYPGLGFFPDDGRIGGTNPNFSTTFLVDIATQDTSYSAYFCGFQSPLTNITDPTDPNIPEVNSGSDLPIKFTVAQNQQACQNGPFITQNIIAVMSLARIYDGDGNQDFSPIDNVDITGGGSAETGRIVFDNPNNKNKPFALQIKLSVEGDNLPAGLYEVRVTDDTAASNDPTKEDIFYFPDHITYFWVR